MENIKCRCRPWNDALGRGGCRSARLRGSRARLIRRTGRLAPQSGGAEDVPAVIWPLGGAQGLSQGALRPAPIFHCLLGLKPQTGFSSACIPHTNVITAANYYPCSCSACQWWGLKQEDLGARRTATSPPRPPPHKCYLFTGLLSFFN